MVEVEVISQFNDHRPGDEMEVTWVVAKRLERQGLVQRKIERLELILPKIQDVLVFTPVYRLEPETVEAVLDLEWDGAISHLFQRDNPSGDGRSDHLHQYRRGREVFLNGRYDAMLIVESDIVPPKDALQKLAAVPAHVAYGVYRFRQSNVINIFERYPDNPDPPLNTGESLSIKPHLLRRAVKEEIFPCSGAGFGIVLIRREVLEETDFRREKSIAAYCDTWFSRDVLRAGFVQMADMSVICGHINEEGETLWPDMNL